MKLALFDQLLQNLGHEGDFLVAEVSAGGGDGGQRALVARPRAVAQLEAHDAARRRPACTMPSMSAE